MIEIKKDSKSSTYIITRTDNEGFHRQIQLTEDEMLKLTYDYLSLRYYPEGFKRTYFVSNDNLKNLIMNFGEAIEALKQGKRVARKGWNGKGMYLWLMPAATVKAEWCKEPHLKELAESNGGEIEALGTIRMLTADKKILTGWLASQTDMLSEDWVIVE